MRNGEIEMIDYVDRHAVGLSKGDQNFIDMLAERDRIEFKLSSTQLRRLRAIYTHTRNKMSRNNPPEKK